MQKRLLGRSKIEISAIIFGGWQSGKDQWVGISDDETIAAHRAAFDSGITTFDTAEAYGGGHSEQILGQALGRQARPDRDRHQSLRQSTSSATRSSRPANGR